MKLRILVALIAALMVVLMVAGVALAVQDPWGGSQQGSSGWQAAPPQPTCGWDWDRSLWRDYNFELWFYSCDYGNGNTYISAFWNPNWGYWNPSQ